jgi:1-acyl-sn-glycerol-3-phosphate acyltransferase
MIIETLLYWLAFAILGSYVTIRLNLKVNKLADIPKNSKILVANHPSVSDPFLLSMALRQYSHILIAEEVFNIRPFGRLLKRMGFICVEKANGRVAFDRSIDVLNRGHNVMLFPEGEVSPLEGGFSEPHTGAARLAITTGAPIIPAGIHIQRTRIKTLTMVSGEEEVSAHWYFNGPYTITFGEPMYFHGDVEDREYVREVTKTIMAEIERLAAISEAQMNEQLTPGLAG